MAKTTKMAKSSATPARKKAKRKKATASTKTKQGPEDAGGAAKQLDVAELVSPPRGGDGADPTGAKEKTVRSARRGNRRVKGTVATASAQAPALPEDRAQPDDAAHASEKSPLSTTAAPKRRSRRGKRSKKRDGGADRVSATESGIDSQPAPASDETGTATPEEGDRGRPAKKAPRRREPGGWQQDRRRAPAKKSRAEQVDESESVKDDTTATNLAPEKGREMVINAVAGDECRIAVLEDGRLEELFMERMSTQSHVGNIYKGRVTNVEPSIQAVFVDFGLLKNGFLHISDVQPQYFPHHSGEAEDVGRKIPRHSRPPIQKCFRRGQEVIVQVTKEGVGTKGPTLTTYLSIPGRFLVMMPGMSKHGVSRKIEDDTDRRLMRDMLGQINLPSGMGFIMRTAGLGRTKRDIQRDLNYLSRLWKTVVSRIKSQSAPAELYQESDLVTRTIRDVYTTDFTRIVVDDADTAKKCREFLRLAMPRSRPVIDIFTEREPIFHRRGIEDEIDSINMREVPLPSGGSIVIDSTEALVAIDVNSGRFRTPDDAEETAYRINMEAATEIARQLRLRDLGGLIVCDFIDMRMDRHKRDVERTLRDGLKKHKERARILKMSAFGLIEMTRQRQGPSLSRNLYDDCPHCRGTGQVKLPESVRLDAMRLIQLAVHQANVTRVVLTLSNALAVDILNQKRAALSQIETETQVAIVIRGEAGFSDDRIQCVCEDSHGRTIPLGGNGSASSQAPQPRPTRRLA